MPSILDLKETQAELDWLNKKLSIKAKKLQGQPLCSVRRGEVYWCEFGYNLGSEIRGTHPCVVIQNNAGTVKLRTAIVAPITHAGNRSVVNPLLVPITTQHGPNGSVYLEGYVDLANLRTVSKARLKSMIAKLPKQDILLLDERIASVFDIYSYYKDQTEKLDKAIKRGDDKEIKVKALRDALMKIQSISDHGTTEGIGEIIVEALKL